MILIFDEKGKKKTCKYSNGNRVWKIPSPINECMKKITGVRKNAIEELCDRFVRRRYYYSFFFFFKLLVGNYNIFRIIILM